MSHVGILENVLLDFQVGLKYQEKAQIMINVAVTIILLEMWALLIVKLLESPISAASTDFHSTE